MNSSLENTRRIIDKQKFIVLLDPTESKYKNDYVILASNIMYAWCINLLFKLSFVGFRDIKRVTNFESLYLYYSGNMQFKEVHVLARDPFEAVLIARGVIDGIILE